MKKVKFLIEIGENLYSKGTVFAFFPQDMYSTYDKNLRYSYAHIGQHSACHKDYAKQCKKAKPDEYKDLLQELVSIGYNLKICK